jgi:UDP-N-acetylglucosamine--dolichyl-phosphate N-acetylglucosaminephosphotransferase
MSPTSLTRDEQLSLLILSGCCLGIIANVFQGDGNPVVASLAFSGLAFASTYAMIRWLGNTFIKAGLKGRDMSKRKKLEMYVGTAACFQLSY